MSEQRTPASDSEIIQILTTEHFTLQTMSAATIAEANGRTTLFLGAVSSSVVALAFIGQISEMGDAFLLFALILLPSVTFLGWVTFLRVYQTGIEDMIAVRGINRIRHYYTEVAPSMKDYFILSTNDDMQGVLQNMGAGKPAWWQLFLSTHGLISVINGVLAAVFVGLVAAALFNATLLVSVIAGVSVFVVSIFVHFRYQNRTFDAAEKNLRVMFPSDTKTQN